MVTSLKTQAEPVPVTTAAVPASPPVEKQRLARGAGSRHDWMELVAIFSDEGKRWTDRLVRSGGAELLEAADRALKRFTAGHAEEGWSLLLETEKRWTEFLETSPSLGHALIRWRWSVVAYGHYRAGELEKAKEGLLRSHRAIVSAIEHAPCLLPLAHQCHELRIQRARVSRAAGRWPEVRGHLRRVEEMLRDSAPLCRLGNGTPVYYRTLRSGFPGSDPPEPLASLLDPRRRVRLLAREAAAVYALPGWIIPFPQPRAPGSRP